MQFWKTSVGYIYIAFIYCVLFTMTAIINVNMSKISCKKKTNNQKAQRKWQAAISHWSLHFYGHVRGTEVLVLWEVPSYLHPIPSSPFSPFSCACARVHVAAWACTGRRKVGFSFGSFSCFGSLSICTTDSTGKPGSAGKKKATDGGLLTRKVIMGLWAEKLVALCIFPLMFDKVP